MTDEIELLDAQETCKIFGGSKPLNPSTLYRGVKAGTYPAPVKLGAGTSRWLKAECIAHVREVAEKRGK